MSGNVYDFNKHRAGRYPNLEPWLTTQQLADHLGFSTKWVQRKVKDGMPHSKFGARNRFKATLVEQWLHEQAEARDT
jgi:excisionase family DNA binding protein